MKRKITFLALLAIVAGGRVKAQMKIGAAGAPDASAILHLESTTKGLRLPQVSLTTTTTFAPVTTPTIAAAARGLTVFSLTAPTSSNTTYPTTGVGVYTWDGTGWVSGNGTSGAAQDLRLIATNNHITKDAGKGGTGTNGGTGTGNVGIGANSLFNIVSGVDNMSMGVNAMYGLTTGKQNVAIGSGNLTTNRTGSNNVAIGYNALGADTASGNIAIGLNALSAIIASGANIAIGTGAMQNASGTNNTGINNVAIGPNALFSNAGNATPGTGSDNVAMGNVALSSNTTGGRNTALGANSMSSNTTGLTNTAVGASTLGLNTIGNENSSFGFLSLFNNTTGSQNTALGVATLSSNSTGSYNTGVGYGAMSSNGYITGNYNTATGVAALASVTTGAANTAVGVNALHDATGGANNTGIGYNAWYHGTGNYNVALGLNSGSNVVAGDNNVSIGYLSMATQTSGSNNIAIGYGTNLLNSTGSDQLNIGNSIFGTSLGGGVASIGINTSSPFGALANNSGNTVGSNGNGLNGGNRSFNWSAGGQGYAASIYNANDAVGSDGLLVKVANASVNTNALDVSRHTAQSTQGVSLFSVRGDGRATVSNGIFLQSTGMPGMTITSTTAAVGGAPANATGNFYYESPGLENHIFGGNVLPDANGGNSLGVAADRWNFIYLVNAPSVSSDIRLKSGIRNVGHGLADVMRMRPVTYDLKSNSRHQIGFIAQEMEKIVPEVVTAPTNSKEFYSMQYESLIPVLTKAIQEQQAEIEALRNDNKKLSSAIQKAANAEKALAELSEQVKALQQMVAQGKNATSTTATTSK